MLTSLLILNRSLGRPDVKVEIVIFPAGWVFKLNKSVFYFKSVQIHYSSLVQFYTFCYYKFLLYEARL